MGYGKKGPSNLYYIFNIFAKKIALKWESKKVRNVKSEKTFVWIMDLTKYCA